jgi:ribulose kinase
LGGIAAGVYASVDDAVRSVHRESRTIEPDFSQSDTYDALFTDVYQHLYQAMRPYNHALFDLFTGSELN